MSNDDKSNQNIDGDVEGKSLDEEMPTMKRFIKLVTSLNTDSNHGAEKALRQIRADILKYSSCIKYLCEKKLFNTITKYLDFPNEKLLNLSISILATCCVQEEARMQIEECNAIPQIVSVLKNISQDGVQNRACRLVANLAQSKEIMHELHHHNVVEPIIKILSSNSSSGTQQSAIRALRLLYESLPVKDWKMESRESILRASAALVVSETLKTSHKDLKQGTLRALIAFTNCRGAHICVNQFSPTFYSSLIENLNDPLACQLAINIARTKHGLMMLNSSYALKKIIDLLSSYACSSSDTPSASSSSEATSMSPPGRMIKDQRHNYLLTVLLCALCAECTGRTQLLTLKDGPAIFLHLLANENNHRIKMQLFDVLVPFTLEPKTLMFLAQNGLVQILVDKLERYTLSHAKPHVKAEKLLCSATDLALEDLSSSQFSSASPVSESSAGASPSRLDRSPLSSPFCASPSTSERSNSPLFAYSPVCSSSGIDSDGPEDEFTDSFRESDFESSWSMTSPSEKKEDMQLAYVLDRLTHCNGSQIDDLVSKRTIETIIKYKVLVNNSSSKIVNFLEKIAKKQEYYCQLLDQQFVLKLHRAWCRPSHSSCCSRCEMLGLAGERVLLSSLKLSETGLGEGEMAHRLLKASEHVKFQIALTVPLVLSDPKLLFRLLFKYHAYEILTRPLHENTANSAQLEDIAFSIKELFRTLGYTNPQIRSIETCRGCDILSLRRASSVTFLLDDGSLVPACKTVLSENSPVFEAMFRGGFRESEETQVRISDVTSVCLEHFVRLVDVYCECTLPTNVSTLLELVSVADRFLVAGLSGQALAHIMNSKLNYRCCQDIFKWAVESKLSLAKDVSNEVIKYIFTAKMSRTQMRKALSSMLEGVYKEKFLKDLTHMIQKALFKPGKFR